MIIFKDTLGRKGEGAQMTCADKFSVVENNVFETQVMTQESCSQKPTKSVITIVAIKVVNQPKFRVCQLIFVSLINTFQTLFVKLSADMYISTVLRTEGMISQFCVTFLFMTFSIVLEMQFCVQQFTGFP